MPALWIDWDEDENSRLPFICHFPFASCRFSFVITASSPITNDKSHMTNGK
jgi:hypothetical protein